MEIQACDREVFLEIVS